MSNVKFIRAAIDKIGIDSLVNNLASLNLDMKLYSRLLFGLDDINQQNVENYIMKKAERPVRKITYNVSKNLLDLFNVTIRFEEQTFCYISRGAAVPEDMTLDDFNKYCKEHCIQHNDVKNSEYEKAVPVWHADSIYTQIEDITE